jgi:type IV secretion system protein VirB5
VGGIAASRRLWQTMAILSMLIVLAAVGGIIAIGSQSKFIPYVVRVDSAGDAIATQRADLAAGRCAWCKRKSAPSSNRPAW